MLHGVLPAAYTREGSDAREYLLYVVVALLVIAASLTGFMALEAHYGHISEIVTQGGEQ